jgi:hypothetical protein
MAELVLGGIEWCLQNGLPLPSHVQRVPAALKQRVSKLRAHRDLAGTVEGTSTVEEGARETLAAKHVVPYQQHFPASPILSNTGRPFFSLVVLR